MTLVVCRLKYQHGVYPICGNSDRTQVWVSVSPNEYSKRPFFIRTAQSIRTCTVPKVCRLPGMP